MASFKSFKMRPFPPFRLDLTVWVLRRTPSNIMDGWDGIRYQRVLVVRGEPVLVSVVQTQPLSDPEITVEYSGDASESDIIPRISKILGLNADMSDFYEIANSYAPLRALASRFVGFKPPRYDSAFEAMVNGISCQQISLSAGLSVLSRLATAYGPSVDGRFACPRPEDMLRATEEDMRALGYSRQKARYILAIAQSIVDGEIDLTVLETMDDQRIIDYLRKIHGIGRWTAQYVTLRGLGRLNIFPADDVGGQLKIKEWLDLESRPDYQGVHDVIDKFEPYRGLLYYFLLLNGQEKKGLFVGGDARLTG